jgi:hypothetical protein
MECVSEDSPSKSLICVDYANLLTVNVLLLPFVNFSVSGIEKCILLAFDAY